MNTRFLPELLAPAGSSDKLHTCLLYGADAVYLGGRTGNLRSACAGFNDHELQEAVCAANAKNARVYYCLNSLPLQADLAALPAALETAAAAGVHGLIVADPGVLRLAARYAPGVPVHLSTQANTANSEAVAFWADQGVERVNLARELSCRDIHAVRAACPDMELEVFVHGAMCLAVSGQCLLSAWLNARSGNQGRCTQPCRFEYGELGVQSALPDALVVDEYTRPGEAVWRVRREGRYSSFWAPQDLCLLPWLSWFAHNRINALKIEGRMKSAGYLAHTVDAYRSALDALGEDRAEPAAPYMTELFLAATRPLGSGFFLHGRRSDLTEEFLRKSGLPSRPNRSGEGALPELGRQVLARITGERGLGVWGVETHGNWQRGMDVELMLPGLRRPVLAGGSYGLENQRGELVNGIGNGTRGVLYADMDGIEAGIFIREARA